jgi:hypothetical protein
VYDSSVPIEMVDDVHVPFRATHLVATINAPIDLVIEPAEGPVPRVHRCGPTACTEAGAWAAWGSPPPHKLK